MHVRIPCNDDSACASLNLLSIKQAVITFIVKKLIFTEEEHHSHDCFVVTDLPRPVFAAS